MAEVKEEEKEVDDKGVPLVNRFKEFERKMEEKYTKELEQTRAELAELKQMKQFEKTAPQSNIGEKNDPKEKLQQFVADPEAFIEQRVLQREWQRQIPEAESWLAGQRGYSKDARARIDALIYENKLNTPNHMPMERARIAWKLYEAEVNSNKTDADRDEERREASTRSSGGEGSSKRVPKETVNKHNELIKQLAAASAKGDLDAEIRLTTMLEDNPMDNTVIRGM